MYIGIMEKKTETIIMDYIGVIYYIRLSLGIFWDHEKENGTYRSRG